MTKQTWKMVIEYDGTNYVGWQAQARGSSIQGELQRAVHAVTRERVQVKGASRTDSGVHALGQVAHLQVRGTWVPRNLWLAINGQLPKDIVVRRLHRAPSTFHAQYDAIGKIYEYRIWNAPVRSPWRRNRAWHVVEPLNVPAMRKAARSIVGRHDFSAFQSSKSRVADARRTLRQLSIRRDGPAFCCTLDADGFLHHMVRNLLGTLVEIGRGRWPWTAAKDILHGRDRRKAGPTAPAQGLCLVRVKYPRRGR